MARRGRRQQPAPGHQRGRLPLPSLADDGTIVAAHDSRLRRLKADGTILSDVATVVTGTDLLGPLDPDVSPDGTKVVYEWGDGRAIGGSTVTLSDRAGGREDLGRLEDSEPSWVDDDTLVLRTPTLGFAVWAPVPTPVDGSRYWFDAGVRPARPDRQPRRQTTSPT